MVPPVMAKTAMLFWVHSHTNITGAEEEHYRRIYTGSREYSLALLMVIFHKCRDEGGATRRDPTPSPDDEEAFNEILQDIGPGPIFRAIFNALRFSKFMGGFPRLRDCLIACSELYLNSGDPSFKEVYLQMPMLQAISEALLRPNMPVPLTGRDSAGDQPALEAYRCAWTHMSYVALLRLSESVLTTAFRIIGTAGRSGSISPSLIDPVAVWRMMVESITVAMEVNVAIYKNDQKDLHSRDGRFIRAAPCESVSYYLLSRKQTLNTEPTRHWPVLRSFENTLLEALPIWTDGIRGSKTGRGGFPKSVVASLVEDRFEGASMWYGLIETTRGRFPAGRITVPTLANMLQAWVEFGTALGFEEGKERDRQAARTCSWRACQYSLMPASKPLMVCKGCQESRYCSTACQRRY